MIFSVKGVGGVNSTENYADNKTAYREGTLLYSSFLKRCKGEWLRKLLTLQRKAREIQRKLYLRAKINRNGRVSKDCNALERRISESRVRENRMHGLMRRRWRQPPTYSTLAAPANGERVVLRQRWIGGFGMHQTCDLMLNALRHFVERMVLQAQNWEIWVSWDEDDICWESSEILVNWIILLLFVCHVSGFTV